MNAKPPFKFRTGQIARYPVAIRLTIFISLLLLPWIPVALFLHSYLGKGSSLAAIASMGLLAIEFVILVHFWGRKIHHQPRPLAALGLVCSRKNGWELLRGFGLGGGSLVLLFCCEGWLGWLTWTGTPAVPWLSLIGEGTIVAVGVGSAEELVFRGWLLDELQRDLALGPALWVSSSIYAWLHYLKPPAEILRTWPGLPGLILLGWTLAWAKQRCQGRLGLPIGLHTGLVWGSYIIHVGQLTAYTGQVPEWVTGLDQNPLAGGAGLLVLGLLAAGMRVRGP